MIGYALVGTSDLERARSFFDALFTVVGIGRMMELPRGTAYGTGWEKPWFGVVTPFDGGPAVPGNGPTIALMFDTRAKVAAIHAKALELGGKDEGPPGLRGDEGPQAYYGAYFRDLDGNKFCAFRLGPADEASRKLLP